MLKLNCIRLPTCCGFQAATSIYARTTDKRSTLCESGSVLVCVSMKVEFVCK